MTSRNILSIALLSMILAACNNDNSLSPTTDNADTPIYIQAGINGTDTRAGYAEGELTEGSFGLFLTTDGSGNDQRYNCSNLKVTYDEGWTTGDTQLLWMNDDANVSYYAYLPYDEAVTDENYSFTVQADQSSEANVKQSDFLLALPKTTTARNGNAIAVNFNHILSKLNVILERGSELDADVTFTSVTFTGCALTASINLQTGEVTSSAVGLDQTIHLCPTQAGTQYECILVPQDLEEDWTVDIEAGGKIYTFRSDESVHFIPCNEYNLTLTVGRDKVSLGGIQAEPWTEVDVEGGLVTE